MTTTTTPKAHTRVGCVHASLAAAAFAALALAGCSGDAALPDAGVGTPTLDAATRREPVVPGRRARVFVFAALGDKCEPLPAPQVAIVQQPAKGDLALVPGQETTIQASAKGTCAGKRALGTGLYYTARDGSEGVDRFAVTATLAGGTAMTRTFEVRIER